MRYFKLFTHTDLDGVACAVLTTLAADAAGDYLEVEYCAAGTAGRRVGEWVDCTHFVPGMDYVVLVTDISVDEFSAQKLDALSRRGKNISVALLDHHELSPKLLSRKWVKADTAETECGTTLLYAWLTEHKLLKKSAALGRFVNDVCLYDTWRFAAEAEAEAEENTPEAPEAEAEAYAAAVDVTVYTAEKKKATPATNAERLNHALYLLGIDGFLQLAVDWFEGSGKPLRMDEHPTLGPIVQGEVERCATYCRRRSGSMRRTAWKGYTVGYAFAEQYISHVAQALLKAHPEIDIAAVISMPDHVSMRTAREDINLSALAGELGGGGHRKASGHTAGKLPDFAMRYVLGFAPRIEAGEEEPESPR